MSILGDAIRSNADLHRAVYMILYVLAASHTVQTRLSMTVELELQCLASQALPHFPPPPPEENIR